MRAVEERLLGPADYDDTSSQTLVKRVAVVQEKLKLLQHHEIKNFTEKCGQCYPFCILKSMLYDYDATCILIYAKFFFSQCEFMFRYRDIWRRTIGDFRYIFN